MQFLVALFGLIIGWQIYSVILVLLVRANKGGPIFGWREGVISGCILLALGMALLAVTLLTVNSLFHQLLAAFASSVVGGVAAHQLWLCWIALPSRRSNKR